MEGGMKHERLGDRKRCPKGKKVSIRKKNGELRRSPICKPKRSPKSPSRSPSRSPKRSPPKSPKRSPPKKSKKLMTKSQVIDTLPYQGEKINIKDINNLKEMKEVWGKHIRFLTPKLIKKLGMKPGTRFIGLSGQQWGDYNDDNQDNRKDMLQHIVYGGFFNDRVDKIEDPYGDETIKYRSTFHEYDDIVVNGFAAYNSDYEHDPGKHYGTGSGADPVFIFVSKE